MESPAIDVSALEALFTASREMHPDSTTDPGADEYRSNLLAIHDLLDKARTGEIRDFDFSPAMIAGAFHTVLTAWVAVPVASVSALSILPPPSPEKASVATGSAQPQNADVVASAGLAASSRHPRLQFLHAAINFFVQFAGFPEFDAVAARSCVPASFADALVTRIMIAPKAEQAGLSAILSVLYKSIGGAIRRKIRRLVGDALSRFATAPTTLPGVQTLLTLTTGIVKGMDPRSSTTPAVVRELVAACLMPLHATNAMLSEEQPLLMVYHDHLVYCVEHCIRVVPDLAVPCVAAVVAAWPPSRSANSPKCVCLLHELDCILSRCVTPDRMRDAVLACVDTLATAAESEYSRIAQRAIALFKSSETRAKLAPHASLLVPQLLPALMRGGKRHWNESVNKHTRALLAWLCAQQPLQFLEALPAALHGSRLLQPPDSTRSHARGTAPAPTGALEAAGAAAGTEPSPMPPPPPRATLANGADAPATTRSSANQLDLSRRAARQALLHRQEREMLLEAGVGSVHPGPSSSGSTTATALQSQPVKPRHDMKSLQKAPATASAPSSSPATSSSQMLSQLATAMPAPPTRPGAAAVKTSTVGSRGTVGGLVASGYATAAPFARRGALSLPGSNGPDPPLTITGAAPWASTSGASGAEGRVRLGASALSSSTTSPSFDSLPPPPLQRHPSGRTKGGANLGAAAGSRRGGGATVRGTASDVQPAPALQAAGTDAEGDQASPPSSTAQLPCLPDLSGMTEEETLDAVVAAVSSAPQRASLQAYLESLKPPAKSKLEMAAAAAAAAPVETAAGGLTVRPVHIEGLKLQDLVFGRTLGSGAFSIVKWCKRVVPGLTQSGWPEFATKVISAETMARLGYERSVEREVAVLKRMTHPGVARLVASFRYGDGAYLVLEFGSRGDLHSQITGMGSLSLESARFAMGEVVAALSAVHRLGFAYGDLKPENILLTESGHVKLTDFGGARPITAAAKRAVQSERHILRHLPDGSWNAAAKATAAADSASGGGSAAHSDGVDSGDDAEDERMEVTAVYMAPELVTGGGVSVATDCWALGCVLYFALAGRPPVWADGVAELMQSIVGFSVESHFPSNFPEDARDLVARLMSKSPAARVSEGPDPLAWVKEHPFFAPLGVPVDELCAKSPPEMAKGTATPQADARWARRQYSMLRAPTPEQFDFVAIAADSSPIGESGAEAGAPFLSSSAAAAAAATALSGANAAAAAATPAGPRAGTVFVVGPAGGLPMHEVAEIEDFEDTTDVIE